MAIIEHPARQSAIDAQAAEPHREDAIEQIRAVALQLAEIRRDLIEAAGERVGRSLAYDVAAQAAVAFALMDAMDSKNDPHECWTLFTRLGDAIAEQDFPANTI